MPHWISVRLARGAECSGKVGQENNSGCRNWRRLSEGWKLAWLRIVGYEIICSDLGK